MNSRRIRTKLALGAVLGLAAAGTALAATDTGPSTTTDPYVLPVAPGVDVTSLLTVKSATDAGAASNGYEMVGIPDGLGATLGPDGDDFTLFMNHELQAPTGVARDHGATGAFVSKWSINSDTLEVEDGADLIQTVRYWNYAGHEYSTDAALAGQDPRFARFCSGFLSLPGQLYNDGTGNGYDGQIYFANEENGDVGRDFGVTTDGRAQQLPRLGLFSWENSLVGMNRGDVTYLQGQEDNASGQLHVYVGEKQDHGNAFDRAGLTNGEQFVVDLHNEEVSTDAQFRATYGKNHPAPFDLGSDEEVDWDQTGAAQNADAAAKGLSLNRIEDGAFDPSHPEDFYFVTTEGGKDATSARDGGGLWRLSYRNPERPWKGGTLTLLLDGTEAPFLNKPDNLGFDRSGHLLIQEDPGNNAHVARIVAYDVKSGERAVLARFDANLFQPGAAGFITQDEESSGIIDASQFLRPRTFLFDAQVHTPPANPADLVDKVERGQLMTLHVDDWGEVFSN
jgi:Bacterial protein of unknown function (DUF839)